MNDDQMRSEQGATRFDGEIPAYLCRLRLRRQEASEYLDARHGLRASPATLAKLACLGGGPRFQVAGRYPIYPLAELDAWAEGQISRVVQRNSDLGGED